MSLRVSRTSLFLPLLCASVACSAIACDPEYEPPGDPPTVDPPEPNQPAIVSKVAPPAISGGTLLISRDGARALVSDPDRDRLVLVALADLSILKTLELEAGDEPGRAVEDATGRAHVALRSGGAVVSLDLATGELLGRRQVCAAPRGLASFEPIDDSEPTLVIGCASGELVEISTDLEGSFLSSTLIEADLRDVILTGDGTRAGRRVLVSSFRSAELITINADNQVQGRGKPAGFDHEFTGRRFAPTVAWRTVPTPTGAIMMHQRSATVPIEIDPEIPSGYGGDAFDCGGSIVNASTTSFNEHGARITEAQRGGLGPQLLPVDIAVARSEGLMTQGPDDRMVAVVAAGSDLVTVTTLANLEMADGCTDNFVNGMQQFVGPEPIAVGFGAMREDGVDVILQLREPSMLVVLDAVTMQWKGQVALGGPSRFDSGHQLFHRNPDAPTTISCAACHPEGREDSHVWQFTDLGARRTQSLEGDVMGSAPFHWDGDLEDMGVLMTTVFEHRMGGSPQSEARVAALSGWLSHNRMVGRPSGMDEAAIARGKVLFEDDTVGCASCHSGATLSNNETVDVGTGKAFQVPSLLGIRNRAPFMHDGCAATLHERFDPKCGGTSHGDVSGLTEAQIDDLVVYMESL